MDVKMMVQACVECQRGNLGKRGKAPLVFHQLEVGAAATSKQQKVEDSWDTLEGRLGSHQCTVLLDTGADTSVVAADLVSETALTGEYFRIWCTFSRQRSTLSKVDDSYQS